MKFLFRRLAAALLAAAAVLALCVPAAAQTLDERVEIGSEAALKLYELGLFRGVGINPDGTPDFNLGAGATRGEGIAMLVRLLGGEREAQTCRYPHPFADADWASDYIGYASRYGISNGVSDTAFGTNQPMQLNQFLTLVLRALGHEDIDWESPYSEAWDAGLYCPDGDGLYRADMAAICLSALDCTVDDAGTTLRERLDEAGALGGPILTEPEQVPSLYTGPDLPEREKLEDSELFSDAVFVGNSLIEGLAAYGKIEYADFLGVTSASVFSIGSTKNCRSSVNGASVTQLQRLCEKQYGKVYILLGINEIGYELDGFIEKYSSVLDAIKQGEPDADIYVMGISPVTYNKSTSGQVFNMPRINRYNEAIRSLAGEKECYYIDLCEALAGPDGYLAAADSWDGVHMQVAKYTDWADYLRTHYAD